MAGLFSAFNILKRAMGAQQYALNTTMHNIANANTEGFSRQMVTMEASTPEGMPAMNSASGPGQVGTGVDVNKITRIRDLFLDTQIRNENAILGQYKSRDEILSEVETILFSEPSENGISANMSKMWNAWQTVANNPEDSISKTNLAQAAQTLTDQFNQVYGQLDKLQSHSYDLLTNQVSSFNSIVKQIEGLNEQIAGVEIAGRNANDLMDKQDLLIDQLSEMADIKVERGGLGEVSITLRKDGSTVVGSNALHLSVLNTAEKETVNVDGTDQEMYKITYYNNGDVSDLTTQYITVEQYNDIKDSKVIFTNEEGNLVFSGGSVSAPDFEEGSILGYASVVSEIGQYKDLLNATVRGIATAVNTLYSPEEYGSEGYTPFFTVKGQNPPGDENELNAGNITVNPDLYNNPVNINAKKNPDDLSGNGERALKISQLRDLKIDFTEFTDDKYGVEYTRDNNYIADNNPNLDPDSELTMINNPKGTTVDSYYQGIINKLGSSEAQASNMSSSQDALIEQLKVRKDSISGVSIDEEIANMVLYQQAYQAAGKGISVIDELLQTVLGLIK